jgi:hypothetical protein
MTSSAITRDDLRRAFTDALADAALTAIDDVLRASTVLAPADVSAALLQGGRAARRIAARRAAAAASQPLACELDAVTLQTLIAAAERAAEIPGHEFDQDSLDEDVHDAASELGSATNNGGVDAQIRFLAEQQGISDVRVLLEGLGVTLAARGGTAAAHPLAAELIARFGLTARTDEYSDRAHADLWSGSGVSPTISRPGDGSDRIERLLGDRAEEVEAWGAGAHRIVWRVAEALALVTYCEGDVSVLQARSQDGWAAIQASAERFYAAQ